MKMMESLTSNDPIIMKFKGKMLEMSLILQAQLPNSTEIMPWQAVEQDIILHIKITPRPYFLLP